MKYINSIFMLIACSIVHGQDFSVSTVTPLDGEIFETSGLIYLEERLITHNDSGDGPYLYEIDVVDGEITRVVTVANAGSNDWEDICYDSEYIYIGDFGNNAGTRTDLCIYKVAISDYLTTPNDTVYCDTIFFNYSDQVDFEPAVYTTNYDAEALIAHNDSLYLFSKNWGNYETNVYSIPKEPGTYSVSIIDNFDTEGLITGADYDPEKNEILFTGYTLTTPFQFFVKGFSGNKFSEGQLQRATPGFEGSIQIEGTASIGNHSFFVSSENAGTGASILHRVDVSNFIGIEETTANKIRCYPNPVNDTLYLEGEDISMVKIFDSSGKLILSQTGKKIPVSDLKPGIYIIVLTDDNNEVLETKTITKR